MQRQPSPTSSVPDSDTDAATATAEKPIDIQAKKIQELADSIKTDFTSICDVLRPITTKITDPSEAKKLHKSLQDNLSSMSTKMGQIFTICLQGLAEHNSYLKLANTLKTSLMRQANFQGKIEFIQNKISLLNLTDDETLLLQKDCYYLLQKANLSIQALYQNYYNALCLNTTTPLALHMSSLKNIIKTEIPIIDLALRQTFLVSLDKTTDQAILFDFIFEFIKHVKIYQDYLRTTKKPFNEEESNNLYNLVNSLYQKSHDLFLEQSPETEISLLTNIAVILQNSNSNLQAKIDSYLAYNKAYEILCQTQKTNSEFRFPLKKFYGLIFLANNIQLDLETLFVDNRQIIITAEQKTELETLIQAIELTVTIFARHDFKEELSRAKFFTKLRQKADTLIPVYKDIIASAEIKEEDEIEAAISIGIEQIDISEIESLLSSLHEKFQQLTQIPTLSDDIINKTFPTLNKTVNKLFDSIWGKNFQSIEDIQIALRLFDCPENIAKKINDIMFSFSTEQQEKNKKALFDLLQKNNLIIFRLYNLLYEHCNFSTATTRPERIMLNALFVQTITTGAKALMQWLPPKNQTPLFNNKKTKFDIFGFAHIFLNSVMKYQDFIAAINDECELLAYTENLKLNLARTLIGWPQAQETSPKKPSKIIKILPKTVLNFINYIEQQLFNSQTASPLNNINPILALSAIANIYTATLLPTYLSKAFQTYKKIIDLYNKKATELNKYFLCYPHHSRAVMSIIELAKVYAILLNNLPEAAPEEPPTKTIEAFKTGIECIEYTHAFIQDLIAQELPVSEHEIIFDLHAQLPMYETKLEQLERANNAKAAAVFAKAQITATQMTAQLIAEELKAEEKKKEAQTRAFKNKLIANRTKTTRPEVTKSETALPIEEEPATARAPSVAQLAEEKYNGACNTLSSNIEEAQNKYKALLTYVDKQIASSDIEDPEGNVKHNMPLTLMKALGLLGVADSLLISQEFIKTNTFIYALYKKLQTYKTSLFDLDAKSLGDKYKALLELRQRLDNSIQLTAKKISEQARPHTEKLNNLLKYYEDSVTIFETLLQSIESLDSKYTDHILSNIHFIVESILPNLRDQISKIHETITLFNNWCETRLAAIKKNGRHRQRRKKNPMNLKAIRTTLNNIPDLPKEGSCDRLKKNYETLLYDASDVGTLEGKNYEASSSDADESNMAATASSKDEGSSSSEYSTATTCLALSPSAPVETANLDVSSYQNAGE